MAAWPVHIGLNSVKPYFNLHMVLIKNQAYLISMQIQRFLNSSSRVEIDRNFQV